MRSAVKGVPQKQNTETHLKQKSKTERFWNEKGPCVGEIEFLGTVVGKAARDI